MYVHFIIQEGQRMSLSMLNYSWIDFNPLLAIASPLLTCACQLINRQTQLQEGLNPKLLQGHEVWNVLHFLGSYSCLNSPAMPLNYEKYT